MGIAAPAKTPQPIVQRLYQDIARVVNGPEYSKFILQQGSEPALLGPEEFGALIRNDLERWAKVVKSARITAD
jgi:tripartite-type tricarboxylate transporter receptor subunit TctC